MKFVKRGFLPVKNFEEAKIATERKHGKLLPNTIRCIICGPSNCGKTKTVYASRICMCIQSRSFNQSINCWKKS